MNKIASKSACDSTAKTMLEVAMSRLHRTEGQAGERLVKAIELPPPLNKLEGALRRLAAVDKRVGESLAEAQGAPSPDEAVCE